ncbi:nuclease-related domain-containing protein [Bacillus sp. EB600]|uniref:nuclease-related domain-containing protein n=1 Tax=Bacillus sp. EB600 TaxID=2806345 RepID=UPI00210EA002|nr:nuclease-related domain-containing protein [Bacillus sp. EB600]MCQ6279883.1 NERD domain-containing protein [Bacillus sp. EB600]
MFLNERAIPVTLQQIITVRSRLQSYHPKQLKLEKSEMKRWAGYHGERTVDKYLRRFAADRFTIVPDLNLVEQEGFQIDTFLYNQCFGLILEIKNILGTVYFDKYSNQMIRIWKGEKDGFSNPILQAQMHKMHLKNWLTKRKFTQIPIEWLVVFSNPATILETTPGNEQIFQSVIHANLLQEKINELEEKYTSTEINKHTSKKLNKLLLEENIPYLSDILQKYELTQADISTGVRCPNCNFVPMLRVSAKWHCPKCKTDSKKAHIPSIYDYLLLNHQTITNHQCRDFLHIPSRRISREVLSDLPLIGTKRGSTYQLTNLLHDSGNNFLLPKNKSWELS